MNSILKNYDVVIQDLEEIIQPGVDASPKAAGIVALMEKFSTYFVLKLRFLVFGATEQTSTTLQYKDISAKDALSTVNASISFLNRQRNERAFHSFYQSVVLEAKEFTNDHVLPRPKKMPKRHDGGGSSHIYENPEQFYRQKYYEVTDLVIAEIQRHFNQPTLTLLKEMETLLIESCNGKSVQLSSTIEELYQADLNIEKLKLQLAMLPDVISTVNNDYHMGIKHVKITHT